MLEFNLLGAQRLAVPAGAYSASASRPIELLAYLVLHAGSEIPRQFLAGLFWPESGGGQALTNLRRELHNLRGLLGDADCLRSGDGTLGWQDSPGARVDVRVFRTELGAAQAAWLSGDRRQFLSHAGLAIEEYRGELMPGSYADWVLEQRDELRQECVQLCDRAAAAWRAADDPRRAAALAKQRIRLEPLEESGYRLLMELQALLGERAAAMQTYHRCAARLEQELGVDPDEATQRLFEQLLGTPAASRGPGAGTVAGTAGTGLVGRGPEMLVLRGRWQAAVGGESGMLVISGDPGVGKSRLAEELAAVARESGAVVAQTRCFSTPGRIPLAPVAAWLRSSAIRSSLTGLPAHWQAEVGRLLPDLVPAGSAAAQFAPGVSRAMVDAWQRHRFFEGLAQAVTGAGRQVLLVLDDLQWCDAETTSWLSYLIGFARNSSLLLVATLRAGDTAPDPAVRALLQGLRSAGLITELALEPLDTADSGALAEALGGRGLSAEEGVLLQAATGGYPLYIVEAARMLPAPPAADAELAAGGLGTVLWRRLGQTSANARGIAGLAAAYGQDISLDLLSEACDLDSAALVEAVDELWRLRILRPRGAGYDFGHDLLRTAAYDHVSSARRWLLHRRLAQGLELLYAGRLDDVAAQLAEQYSLGSRPDRALYFFERAAGAAAAVFANAEALKFYRRCLLLIAALPPGRDRGERELAILRSMSPSQTALYGYSSEELLTTLERTEELARQLGQPEVLLGSLIGLFAARFVQGRTADAYRIAQRALALAEADPDPDLLGQAHFTMAGAALTLGRPGEAMEHFSRCYGSGTGGYSFILGTNLQVHALAWASHAHWLAGDDDGAVALCAEALSRARAAHHPYSLAVALAFAAVLHQFRGDTAALGPAAAELRGICDRYDFAYYGPWGLILQGWLAGDAGGTEHIRAGIRSLQSQDAFARMPYWLSLLAGNLIAAHDAPAARSVLDAALAAAEQRDDRWWLPEVLRLRAGLETGPAADQLLRRARELAAAQSSPALLARCG